MGPHSRSLILVSSLTSFALLNLHQAALHSASAQFCRHHHVSVSVSPPRPSHFLHSLLTTTIPYVPSKGFRLTLFTFVTLCFKHSFCFCVLFVLLMLPKPLRSEKVNLRPEKHDAITWPLSYLHQTNGTEQPLRPSTFDIRPSFVAHSHLQIRVLNAKVINSAVLTDFIN